MSKTLNNGKNNSEFIPTHSGATGGPGNFRGTNYQINYAVFIALEMIDKWLCAPHIPFQITMEHRNLFATGSTNWDIETFPPKILIEAKLTATKKEVIEWLNRIKEAEVSKVDLKYHLIHNKSATGFLLSLEKVHSDALETVDTDSFLMLATRRDNPHVNRILRILGTHAYTILRQIKLINVPETHLQEDIDNYSRRLVGETKRTLLRDFLFNKLSNGASARVCFLIKDLVKEVRTFGIDFHFSSEFDKTNLSEHAVFALSILQTCPHGLPSEILSKAINYPMNKLVSDFSLLSKGGMVTKNNDLWTAEDFPKFDPPNRLSILSRTLEELLAFIDLHKDTVASRHQIENAIQLAKESHIAFPNIVANVFRVLDKLLKERGDKHLVLEVAKLSIDAATRSSRTSREVEGEAQALICGLAWVYQRIGRLNEARVAAERSLKLGEDISWDRNTTFSKKCIGCFVWRLRRNKITNKDLYC